VRYHDRVTAQRGTRHSRKTLSSPWWASESGRFTLTRGWIVALVLLTLAVGATRLAALPGSLWHQDEVEFASSVLDFDITWNRPHPPWFPLWIVLGKAVHGFSGLSAARSLQLLSSLFSTATLLPLALLWGLWLRRELAVAAAFLFLLLPGVWMLSGRAFTDTPALALLAGALVCWLDRDAGPRRIALGSVLAGLTILVRPHHAVLLLGPLIVAWRRGAGRRALLIPGAALGTAGAAGLLIWGGPPALLWKALRLIGAYQKAIMATATTSFEGLGLSRIVLHAPLAVLWLILAAAGAVLLARSRIRGAGDLLWATVLPVTVVLFVFFDPVEPRYWLPFLALSSGLVLVAVAAAVRSWSLAAAAAALAASCWAVVPSLASFRHEISPPFLGIARAERLARTRGWAVVADLNIRPFAEYLRLDGQLAQPIVYDVELGRNRGVPPPWSVVALYTDRQNLFVVRGGQPVVFSCRTPLLHRLVPGPYLVTTVVPAATVRPAPRRERNEAP